VSDLEASGFMLVGGDGAHLDAKKQTSSSEAGDPTSSGLTGAGAGALHDGGSGGACDGEATGSELEVLPDEGIPEVEHKCVVLAAKLARELSRSDPGVLMRILDGAARRRVQGGGMLPQLGRLVEHE